MQLHTLLVIIAPAIATVQAGCFNKGPKWSPTRGQALVMVDQICNSRSISGTFSAGQTKNRCINLRDDAKVQFEVQWTGSGTRTLADKDCVLRLKNEINGCDQGGQSIVSDWRFKSDPNDGTC